MSRGRVAAGLLVAMAAIVAASCSTSGSSSTVGTAERSELRVSAAASLTDAFAELERAFEAGHPSVDVVVNLGPSDALAEQALDGAPVHVVAFADDVPMRSLVSAGLLDAAPQAFASNRLVAVVPTGSAAGSGGLASLSDVGVVALCAPTVPCGRHAERWLSGAGVALDESSVTRSRDARATLSAVTDGDADAAVVYATDARAARGRVAVIATSGDDVEVHYPIAALAGAPAAAAEFVQLVRSAEGQRILRSQGFGPP